MAYELAFVGWNMLFVLLIGGCLFGIVFPFVKKRDMIDSFGCAVAFSVVLLLGSVMWHIKPWDSFASKTVERSCE